MPSQQTQSDMFHTKMLQNALWCQITWSKCMLCNILEYCSQTLDIHGHQVLQLIFSTLYMYSNRNYQNLPGKMCRIEQNPIMISPYPIFEVNKLRMMTFFKFLISTIFSIFQTATYLMRFSWVDIG
jgi:hypothetical protein